MAPRNLRTCLSICRCGYWNGDANHAYGRAPFCRGKNMDRSELLAQLRGHGNHLNVTRSEHPSELAKGMGLLLLGLEQLLLDEEARGEGARNMVPAHGSALRPDLAPQT